MKDKLIYKTVCRIEIFRFIFSRLDENNYFKDRSIFPIIAIIGYIRLIIKKFQPPLTYFCKSLKGDQSVAFLYIFN